MDRGRLSVTVGGRRRLLPSILLHINLEQGSLGTTTSNVLLEGEEGVFCVWYAKRFLHPDIVAPYDYIFLWDEDLGVEHFDAEEYIRLVKKHGLEISQPAVESGYGTVWDITKRKTGYEVHKELDPNIKPLWCREYRPPCAGFVEIMAPVFSKNAWRCAWHMIQNDLVHGWGLDKAFGRCVEPPQEKMGIVDDQWVVHQHIPSLGNQGEEKHGQPSWQGVNNRCKREEKMFANRLKEAEKQMNS